jgi:hypothetical protein
VVVGAGVWRRDLVSSAAGVEIPCEAPWLLEKSRYQMDGVEGFGAVSDCDGSAVRIACMR